MLVADARDCWHSRQLALATVEPDGGAPPVNFRVNFRVNYGGIMVESWWNHGGIMVESWWNNCGLIVELWWNYCGIMVEL